jgi:DNA-directed RNA polymerase specialized sigma subunit
MDQMFPSVVNDGMPKGSQQSDLSDYMVLLDEQIDRLKQERLKKARTREQIDLAIRRMENPDEQRVLRLRYLWGLNWKEIGEKMGYNERQPQRIHGSALNNFKMS